MREARRPREASLCPDLPADTQEVSLLSGWVSIATMGFFSPPQIPALTPATPTPQLASRLLDKRLRPPQTETPTHIPSSAQITDGQVCPNAHSWHPRQPQLTEAG